MKVKQARNWIYALNMVLKMKMILQHYTNGVISNADDCSIQKMQKRQ